MTQQMIDKSRQCISKLLQHVVSGQYDKEVACECLTVLESFVNIVEREMEKKQRDQHLQIIATQTYEKNS